ncbi:MAG TPA: alpha-L-arabinofuranosidase C-terminal domain-containing protein [Sedimentisphaerales bacterium]|nr:alpha-L-arabinofuranosidase C-terminal domain-containing protein [Sedimentisphaerales bacterium]
MARIATVCVVFCLWGSSILASERPAADAAGISFRLTPDVLHGIDSRLFGQFMERPSWGEIGPEGARIGGTRKLQPRVLELLAKMEIPVVRFPGGTDVDFLDWCDMVDNVPGRAAQRPISTGHRGHKVTNNFGYDEFLQFCEDVRAEAIIVVNFRDGLLKKRPLKEAAEHAAALVAYCNAPVGKKLPDTMYDWPSLRARNGRSQPYKVKYFQIGNETWAFVRQLKELAGGDAAQWYAECMAAYVEAMQAVDPSIEIIVDGQDGEMSGIVPQVRERVGDKVAYFATHFYCPWAITRVLKRGQEVPIGEIPASDIWGAWVAVTDFDANGQSVLNHPGFNAARRHGYKVAVTEWNWNGWWRYEGPPPALNSSFAKGLGAAGYLHAFIRAADVIGLGCQSMLVGNAWGIHAIKADAKGEIPPYYMPTGQVTMFYSKHHGDKLLALESRNVPMYEQPYQMGGIRPSKKIACIDALATASEERIYLHAINRSFEQTLDIVVDVSAFGGLDGRAVHHLLEGRLNDAPEPAQERQIGHISQRDIRFDGNTLGITLPQRSVSCIEFVQK